MTDASHPVTLFLVRHGVADGAAGRCIGHCDLALSRDGRESIARLAARWDAPRPQRVIASDLARARDSAAVLSEAWQLREPMLVDARLREMNFGVWDGRSWDEIERNDSAALAEWMAEWQHRSGLGGECFGDVIARASDWLSETVENARRDSVAEIAVVAHAGWIRGLLVHTVGMTADVAFRMRLDHAHVSAVRITGDPLGEILFLNAEQITSAK